MIRRDLESHLRSLATQFPVIGVTGPQQSGKTKLVQATFSEYAYVTLEDLDMRRIAIEDPRRFFATYTTAKGLIIDEVQQAPDLLSYMQGIIDAQDRPGFFVIIGSQNLLMHEKISQSLAGRIALLTLLPLSVHELEQADLVPETVERIMFKGLYPRLYVKKIDIRMWFSQYIATYVERDVRQLTQITNMLSFQRFIKLCAARTGNLLNYADLARDADISPNTAKAWISVLEASYILTVLPPYHTNFNKRLVKSPKLYFYDSGLVCSLLDIKDEQELFIHPLRGAIFETFIISELLKYRYNKVKRPQLYFWRDVQGHEIDCLFEKGYQSLIPLEIKSSMTITPTLFKGLSEWLRITGHDEGYVIYAGNKSIIQKEGTLVPWTQVHSLMDSFH